MGGGEGSTSDVRRPRGPAAPSALPTARSLVPPGLAPLTSPSPASASPGPALSPLLRADPPARPSRSYKSRLRARGPGHSEQLRRGDCTARPAGPAPTGARRPQQPQHRDLGPCAGYGCALGLSAQVGTPGAPRRNRGTGLRERARGGGWQGLGEAPWAGVTGKIQFGARWAAQGRTGRRHVASWEPSSASGVGALVGAQVGQSWKIAPRRGLL